MSDGFIPETEVQEIQTETVEAETDASEAVLADEGLNNGIELYSAYDGSFSNTYVEYFRGFASKLPPSCHYLCFRDGQYSYVFYCSAGLSKSGNIVSGTAGYYRLNVYNGYRLTSGVADVNEDITQGMYYSDFDGCPSLMGGEYYVQVTTLFLLCVIFVFVLLHVMYRFAKRFRS